MGRAVIRIALWVALAMAMTARIGVLFRVAVQRHSPCHAQRNTANIASTSASTYPASYGVRPCERTPKLLTRLRAACLSETCLEGGAYPLQDFGVAMEQVRDVGAGEHCAELEGELLGRLL